MDRNSRASSKWQPVSGIVVDSSVVEVKYDNKKGGQIDYNPVIIYEYESPQGLVRNDDVTYGGPAMKPYRFQAEKIVAQYVPGTAVTVYFNPENPRQSCLEPGRTRSGIALMVVGGLLLLGELVVLGFRELDRYSGLGEFNPNIKKQAKGKTAKSLSKEKEETPPSLLHEYLANARNSPLFISHIETHLIFGPIYRREQYDGAVFLFFNAFFGRRFSMLTDEEKLFFFFFLTKVILGGLAVLFIFVSPFLFLMKAADAPADLFLGLIWCPGLEFIPRFTEKQKYITICRILFTIPAVYMGVNSGNWSW